MADDVVERLREAADNAEALNWDNTTAILREAASALTEARKENERLREERETYRRAWIRAVDAARGEGEGNTTPTETEVMPPGPDSRHGLPMPNVPVVPVDPPSPAPAPTVEELSGGLHGHRVWDARAPSPCNATLHGQPCIRHAPRDKSWQNRWQHERADGTLWNDAAPGAKPHVEPNPTPSPCNATLRWAGETFACSLEAGHTRIKHHVSADCERGWLDTEPGATPHTEEAK